MYSGGNEPTAGFPTSWNLNPVAYQNIDASQVDWAALAQQWIQMKETYPADRAPPPQAPPPPVINTALEGGEAPMDVEGANEAPPAPSIPPAQWNNTNNWSNDVGWNQWNAPAANWGWNNPKPPPPAPAPPPATQYTAFQRDGPFPGFSDNTGFERGYWTSDGEAAALAVRPEGVPPPNLRPAKVPPDRSIKPPLRTAAAVKQYSSPLPIVDPPVLPSADETEPVATLDAAKRRTLPAWIREGLEKMEREKQKQLEKERQMKEEEQKPKDNKWEENDDPAKSKFDSDGEESNGGEIEPEADIESAMVLAKSHEFPEEIVKVGPRTSPPRLQRNRQEMLEEVMLSVRRALTEILLDVTNEEIQSVSQEELARYKASKQATRAATTGKSQALASLGGGLGLGIYGDSSGSDSGSESEGDRTFQDKYISDAQLQEMIRRRRSDFEKTAREIEAEIAEADAAASQVERDADTPPRAAQPLTNKSTSSSKEDDCTPPHGSSNSASESNGTKHEKSDKIEKQTREESISRSEKTKNNKSIKEEKVKDEKNYDHKSYDQKNYDQKDYSRKDDKTGKKRTKEEKYDKVKEEKYERIKEEKHERGRDDKYDRGREEKYERREKYKPKDEKVERSMRKDDKVGERKIEKKKKSDSSSGDDDSSESGSESSDSESSGSSDSTSSSSSSEKKKVENDYENLKHRSPEVEYTSKKRKRSEKSRSRSYDKSTYYRSRTSSRERSKRREQEKYYDKAKYQRRERDRSDDRLRGRSRSYERSKGTDRYRDHRERRRDTRSRSKSRSSYYRSSHRH